MDFNDQLQKWNEDEEYQKIVDAIEALPAPSRTPELDSELARAYNNLAEAGDREFFKKAIRLLAPHEEYFEGDHNWNFRMAYAHYYLDREGTALRYFEQALKARPGDEDTQAFIEDCRERLALPRFEKNFRERTALSWSAFEAGEAKLRSLMDQKDRDEVSEGLIGTCNELLSAAFDDVAFELGFNGEKYELILSPEGSQAKLFKLVYFQKHAPASVSEHWNIIVGRQPSPGFGLSAFGQMVSAADVQVWVSKSEDQTEAVSLTLYCEKLLPFLRENEGRAWWMLSNLTDQVLGEIPAMSVIESFEVADVPLKEPAILLSELPGILKDMGLEPDPDPEVYLDNSYVAYSMEPKQDPDAIWRLDTCTGVTRCPSLINEYLRGEGETVDEFYNDGAAAGFFCYPLDGFKGEEQFSRTVLDFRDALEAAVLKQSGEDAVTFLGGATGIYCGYLDFIAWDLPAVLAAAAEFFRNSPVAWANFHMFCQGVNTVGLVDKETVQNRDN